MLETSNNNCSAVRDDSAFWNSPLWVLVHGPGFLNCRVSSPFASHTVWSPVHENKKEEATAVMFGWPVNMMEIVLQ